MLFDKNFKNKISSISALNPFINYTGILRFRRRLSEAELPPKLLNITTIYRNQNEEEFLTYNTSHYIINKDIICYDFDTTFPLLLLLPEVYNCGQYKHVHNLKKNKKLKFVVLCNIYL